MPDVVVAEPGDVDVADGLDVVELDELTVADVDWTGGGADVVQADVVATSPRAIATATPANRRLTLHPLTHP